MRKMKLVVVAIVALVVSAAVLAPETRPAAGPPDAETSDPAPLVVERLAGIQQALEDISVLLGAVLDGHQVSILMTRIQLAERKLAPLETDLRRAQQDRETLADELKRLKMLEEEWERQRRERDPALPEDTSFAIELRRLRNELELLEQRSAALEQRTLDLENQIARRRDDLLALEEMVDERLGLR